MPARFFLVPFLVLSACSSASEPPHNERYFYEHASAREEMLQRCSRDQNSENPMNCMAAENAKHLVDTEKSLSR